MEWSATEGLVVWPLARTAVSAGQIGNAVVIGKRSNAIPGSQVDGKHTSGGMWRRIGNAKLTCTVMIDEPNHVQARRREWSRYIFPRIDCGRGAVVEVNAPFGCLG